jgi:hypothetical protein
MAVRSDVGVIRGIGARPAFRLVAVLHIALLIEAMLKGGQHEKAGPRPMWPRTAWTFGNSSKRYLSIIGVEN